MLLTSQNIPLSEASFDRLCEAISSRSKRSIFMILTVSFQVEELAANASHRKEAKVRLDLGLHRLPKVVIYSCLSCSCIGQGMLQSLGPARF